MAITNKEILDEIETAMKFAETMTWKGKNPKVRYVKKEYKTGIKISKAEMEAYEQKMCGCLDWKSGLLIYQYPNNLGQLSDISTRFNVNFEMVADTFLKVGNFLRF